MKILQKKSLISVTMKMMKIRIKKESYKGNDETDSNDTFYKTRR